MDIKSESGVFCLDPNPMKKQQYKLIYNIKEVIIHPAFKKEDFPMEEVLEVDESGKIGFEISFLIKGEKHNIQIPSAQLEQISFCQQHEASLGLYSYGCELVILKLENPLPDGLIYPKILTK